MSQPQETSSQCLAPSHEIVVTSQGFVAPCCVYQGMTSHVSLITKDSKTFPEQFSEVTNLFKLNATPLSCVNCFKREHDGLISKRQKLEKKLGSLNQKNWKHAEISFSNTCNLDCIICSSHFSNRVKKIHELFVNSVDPHLAEHHKNLLFSSSDYQLTEMQTQLLAEKLPHLDSLEIIGGEPTLFPHLDVFFKTLLTQKNIPQKISIVTNGTFYPEALMKRLLDFDQCQISLSLSIDGVNDIYKYIRGFDFKRIESVVIKYINNPSIHSIYIKPTLGLVNFNQILPLYQWVKGLESLKVDLLLNQFLSVNEPLSATSIPMELRTLYKSQLKKSEFYKHKNKNRIDLALEMLENYPAPNERTIMTSLENIKKINQLRSLDLFTIHPELTQLIDLTSNPKPELSVYEN